MKKDGLIFILATAEKNWEVQECDATKDAAKNWCPAHKFLITFLYRFIKLNLLNLPALKKEYYETCY